MSVAPAAPGDGPATYPVAVIGVGNMGAAMAANLLSRSWPVAVCDLLPERSQALAEWDDAALLQWLTQGPTTG